MEFNEYTNAPEATAPKNKPRKSSGAAKSIVTVLLCVLLGGGAGDGKTKLHMEFYN